MSRTITEVEADWRQALAEENVLLTQQLVVEILQEHPLTTLASELRYNRGFLTLAEGEGTGMERLARALSEFSEGIKAAEANSQNSEPWRTLNRTQYGICMARRGNIEAAEAEFKKIIAYRPRTIVGLGAFSVFLQILEENDKTKEVKRYNTQRISYARGLVRENKDSESFYLMQFLLSLELLNSEYAKEGEKLLQELGKLSIEVVGEDLYSDIQGQLAL